MPPAGFQFTTEWAAKLWANIVLSWILSIAMQAMTITAKPIALAECAAGYWLAYLFEQIHMIRT